MDRGRFLFILFMIFLVILIIIGFGYYGYIETLRLNAKCDLGFFNFCWKWTQEIIIQKG